jgi:flagellar protein FliS
MDTGLQTYQTVDTLGKSQIDLILKVYDGAMGAFEAARRNFIDSDVDAGRSQLDRARRFLVHLYTTLDEDQGGDIARSLSKLYTYLICQIDTAKATRDAEVVEGCVRILQNLRAGWMGLREQEEAEQEPAMAEETSEGSFEISG